MNRRWITLPAVLLLWAATGLCPAAAQEPILLSAAQKQWRDQHPVVRYTVYEGLHPIEDVDSEGRPTGIVQGYLEMIGRDTGLTFEFVRTRSWREAVKRFEAGDIDLLPNVSGILADSVAPGNTALTLPYFSSPLVAVGRADAPIITTVAEMKGKTVALRRREGVQSLALPGVRVISYSDTDSMLAAVLSGSVDYAIGADALYPPVVRSQYVGELGNAGYLDRPPLESRMMVMKQNTELLGLLDSAISHLTAEETDLLYLHWLEQVDYGAPNARAIWRYLGLEVALLASLLVALAIAVAWAVRARTAARNNEVAKARFLAMMSHEVRTPVNIMVGSIEAIEQTALDRRQQEIIGIVRASADALVDLLNNVLDLSRLDERALVLAPTAVDLRQLLTEITALAKVQADAKGIALQLQTQGLDDVAVMLDATRIRQVLNNLIGNALKFTEQGRIDVQARLHGDGPQRTLCLSVADTGIGIAPDQQAGLFDPYAQADSSITRRYGGSGLGLALCRTLVELMGGRIELQSQPGQGTTLSLTVPVHVAAGIEPDAPEPATLPAGTARARVMVVDDVLLNATVLRDQLASLSVEATLFTDARTAIADLATRHYDMILMDCHMPGMDGYEAVRTIKAGMRSAPPVIATSASTDAEHQVRCTRAGFDGALSKPLRTKDLLGLLDLWGIAHGSVAVAPAADAASQQPPDFLVQLSSDWHALQASCLGGDLPMAAHHAHRMKGVALVFGNSALAEVMSRVESLAAAGGEVPAGLLQAAEACLHDSYVGFAATPPAQDGPVG